MDTTQLKAHVFDAEQALRWARDAIEAGDLGAIKEAIASAGTAVAQAREVIDSAAPPSVSLRDTDLSRGIRSGLAESRGE